MTTSPRRRGQPLIVLGAIMVSWVAMRAAVWQAPFALPERVSSDRWAYRDGERTYVPLGAPLPGRTLDRLRALAGVAPKQVLPTPPVTASDERAIGREEQRSAVPVSFDALLAAMTASDDGFAPDAADTAGSGRMRMIPARMMTAPVAVAVADAPVRSPGLSPRIAGGHQMLWMAAVANLPLPSVVTDSLQAQRLDPAPLPPRAVATRPSRWSGDGWLMLRRGGASGTGLATGGPALATYGASQLGAVIRYRLDQDSRHRPALYLRGSAALNGSAEREVAAGVSLRPIARLPVAVLAEARVGRLGTGTKLRGAVMAVSELPPFALSGGLRGEAYAAAGYVSGAAATGFVDGQVRADGRIARLGKAELRAGAGAWGGAQDGAGRLDIGPTATLGFSGGGIGARLGVDWRFRVAGNAAPSSGPALTLSAGF